MTEAKRCGTCASNQISDPCHERPDGTPGSQDWLDPCHILEYLLQIVGCQEKPMPRPRIFDEDAALAAATAEFWQRGYAGTSVRDLGASMEIGRAHV